jgi:hypothetical protein
VAAPDTARRTSANADIEQFTWVWRDTEDGRRQDFRRTITGEHRRNDIEHRRKPAIVHSSFLTHKTAPAQQAFAGQQPRSGGLQTAVSSAVWRTPLLE